MRFTSIFATVPLEAREEPRTRAVRALAIAFATMCVAISLALLNRFAFYGFAIGGWTGLPQYREALAAARTEQTRMEFELLVTQILGGAASAMGFAPRQSALQYLKKLPLFILLFCVTTALVSSLAIQIAGILLWMKHHSPLE
jgi:hypothetical protein